MAVGFVFRFCCRCFVFSVLFCFCFVSGFGGSQGSPDLLNSGTQEAQGPSCEKSFNREELIAGGRSRVVPLLLCPPARVPSVAIWAVLEEILEFSYSGAFPRLAWPYSSFPRRSEDTQEPSRAMPPVPPSHVDLSGVPCFSVPS